MDKKDTIAIAIKEDYGEIKLCNDLQDPKKFVQYFEINTKKSKYTNKEVGNIIHEQLAGNKDYIDSAIILNIDEKDLVRLWIFDNCKSNVEIKIIKNDIDKTLIVEKQDNKEDWDFKPLSNKLDKKSFVNTLTEREKRYLLISLANFLKYEPGHILDFEGVMEYDLFVDMED